MKNKLMIEMHLQQEKNKVNKTFERILINRRDENIS